MIHAANAWKSYRQNATLTATPGQIILMLFAGTIRFLESGLAGFTCTDLAQQNMAVNNNFQRAQEIIRQLNLAIDMEKGGEVAVTLRTLYDYFDRRIHESNIRKQPEGAREVIRLLTILHDAWASMLKNPEGPTDEAPQTELEAA